MTISVEKAKERLAANRYDLNAWNALIKDALDKNIDQTREFFDDLITQFPTCGRFWKIYIEQELKEKNYQNAEKLFEKCLNISNIDLWKCFLAYLRETKHNENGYNKIMIEAYDSALKKIGLDVMSYSIWQDYITFLKSLEANLESDAEKQTLYESIRKIYIEAHRTPMINIEQIWKDYILFENQLNPENARRLAEEMAKEFQSIKRISREYENITRPLERHLPALPIMRIQQSTSTTSTSSSSSSTSPDDATNNSGDQEMLRQSNAWKRYILWEKRNPLNLHHHQEVMKRVLFAYEQSFLCLAYNFDIWYEAASYLCQQKDILLKKATGESSQLNEEEINDLTENAAANLFNRAINSFMNHNQLIYLVYADFEEQRKNYTKVQEIYEKYLQNQQVDPTLIWIHYIRFVMRSEDITAARKMFKRAREDPRSGYHLFIAQANLEYFHTKDKTIGFKILHLGAKKFSHEPEYMLAYIKYMNHLNEDNNTRVLFERILSTDDLLPQKTNEIWSEFLKFECAVGDLASILKVDRKRQKLHDSSSTQNEMTPSILMIDRYRYLDMLPCNSNELKAMGYKDSKQPNNTQLSSTNNSTNISSLTTNFSSNVNLASGGEMEIAGIKQRKGKFPVPDVNQMLPFKPTRNALPGMMHSIAGGVFPFPPAVTDLVKRLPPPTSFDGPFVKIDELIRKIQEAEYHEDFQPMFVMISGEPMRDLENIAASMAAALNPNLQYTAATKRSAVSSSTVNNNNNNNSDDEDSKKAKTMDIYKQRQYKKLIKK